MKIEQLIKQENFNSELLRLLVNLKFTSNALDYEEFLILKKFDLSSQQFNILRIVKGQKGKPIPLKLITERMIDRMSNTSRLVDKLVAKDFLSKETNKLSKRQIDISITKKGLAVIDKASVALDSFFKSNSKLSESELKKFNELVDKLRESYTSY
jgi:DNA-binding MarR family transcriptional regulator